MHNIYRFPKICGKPGSLPGFPKHILRLGLATLFLLTGMRASSQIPYLPGWPVDVAGYYSSPIYIADVDDDGQLELVFSDSQDLVGSPLLSKLYVYKYDGTLETGWPVERGGGGTGPLLTDIDDDGRIEIFSTYSGVHLYRADGSLIWEHLYDGPIFQSIYLPSQVSVDDLDNDGQKDLIVTCYWGGAIFVFDAQGNVRPGWPVVIPPRPGWSPPPIYMSASIGDIDKDGLKEIVVGVDNGTFTDPSQVFCFKPDGSYCPGFPVGATRQGYRSKVVLVDIDGDGYREIVIGKETFDLRVYRHDGSLFPGYPIPQSARLISIGDIYRNGQLEMIMGDASIMGNDLLTGAVLPNFPFKDPAGTYKFPGQGGQNICYLSG